MMKRLLLTALLLALALGTTAQTPVKYLASPVDKHAYQETPKDRSQLRFGGVAYPHGFYLFTTQGPTKHGYAEFALNKGYKQLNFVLGTSPNRTNATQKGVFVVTLDGRKVLDKVVDPQGSNERITLDVTGVSRVRFEIVNGEVDVAVGEPTLWTASQQPRELGDVCPFKGDRPVRLVADGLPYQSTQLHSLVTGKNSVADRTLASVRVSAQSYDNGIFFSAHEPILGISKGETHFNLGGRFSKLAFVYGPIDSDRGTLGKGWITIRCDGRILREIEVDEGDIAKRIVLDIKGCNNLSFETENEQGSLEMAAVEIWLYPEGFDPEADAQTASPQSANLARLPDVCPLMSNITPYAVGGGMERDNAIFDGKSEHITFSMGGTRFWEGFLLRASSNILNDNTRAHVLFSLERQFDYISFTTGWLTKCGVLKNDTLRIYADDRVVFDMPLFATSPNQYFEVPIHRCAKLMFELRGRSTLSHPVFGVADIVLYRGKPVPNDLFRHPAPQMPDQADLIDLGAPYIHYVPTMKDWPDKIFYDGTTQRRYFDNDGVRINKGFLLQTSVHFDFEMGPTSDPGVGVVSTALGASMMVGTVGGMTISAVFPFGCLLALASGGTALESSCAAFNTWGEYDYVSFTVAPFKPSKNREERLIVGTDGEVASEFVIYDRMEPTTYVVPLKRCRQLMFWLECGDNTSGQYLFYDLKLYRGAAPKIDASPAASPASSSAYGKPQPATKLTAKPDPYLLPVRTLEWSKQEWTMPGACNVREINDYYRDVHDLKVQIDRYMDTLNFDYKMVAYAVTAPNGDSYRMLGIEGPAGKRYSVDYLLNYDQQVLRNLLRIKGQLATLALSFTNASLGVPSVNGNMIQVGKQLKATSAMMNQYRKQVDALEADKKEEVRLLKELQSKALTPAGITPEENRLIIR